jgi:DnaJ-class molecular chaperone
LFRRNKGKKEEESRFAKLRQGAANVLKDPRVRREAQRLAKDPRVQRKAKEGFSRVWQRLRRR